MGVPRNSGGGFKPTPLKKPKSTSHTGSANATEHHAYPKTSPSRRVSKPKTSPKKQYVQHVASKRTSSPSPRHKSAPKATKVASKPMAKPAAPVAAPKPVIPGVDQYLGTDTTYQDQQAQLRKAYAEYVASQNTDRTAYQGQYGLNEKNLTTDKTQAFTGLTDDYASRGLINSGVYGQAYSDLQGDYNQRQTQLDTDKQNYLTGLTTDLTNFKGTQDTTSLSARQEAIARRAAKYNLKV